MAASAAGSAAALSERARDSHSSDQDGDCENPHSNPRSKALN